MSKEGFHNPYTLPEEEVLKIVSEVNDSRLENRAGDYFVLHREGKETFVPKQKKIRVEYDDGSPEYVNISEYIQDLLEEDEGE